MGDLQQVRTISIDAGLQERLAPKVHEVVSAWEHVLSSTSFDINEARRVLGKSLKACREAASYTQQSLAAHPLIHYGRSTIANVEVGRQAVGRKFWAACDVVLGAGGALAALYDQMARVSADQRISQLGLLEGHRQGDERRLHEPEATVIRCADPGSRGFLSFAAHDDSHRAVGTYDDLFHGINGGGNFVDNPGEVEEPEDLIAIFGGLTEVANIRGWKAVRPLVVRQLSEFERRHHDGLRVDVRLGLTESRWLEFMSWVCDNDGSGGGDYWVSRAYAACVGAKDEGLAAYMLMRKSQRALDNGDAHAAIALSRKSLHSRQLPPKIQALCLSRLAEALALAGDEESLHLLALALRRVGDSGRRREDLVAQHCDQRYLLAARARCLHLLGRAKEAVALLAEVLEDPTAAAPIDRCMWLVYQAEAYAPVDPERAALAGRESLQLAKSGVSARVVRGLTPLAVTLRPHGNRDHVQAFLAAHREAFAALLPV